jgi:3-oxoacyl-[acyl-carrier protein] reductase
VARALAAQGARVVLAARSQASSRRSPDEIGAAGRRAPGRCVSTSPTRRGGSRRLEPLPEEFAQIDVLVNNAGITADTLLRA